MPDRVLSSSTRKICMSCTAFLIRYNSLYLIAALLPASSFRCQTVISVGKQVFIELIVYLFKGRVTIRPAFFIENPAFCFSETERI